MLLATLALIVAIWLPRLPALPLPVLRPAAWAHPVHPNPCHASHTGSDIKHYSSVPLPTDSPPRRGGFASEENCGLASSLSEEKLPAALLTDIEPSVNVGLFSAYGGSAVQVMFPRHSPALATLVYHICER